MKYGIQWIDYGGEFNHSMSDIDLHKALERLGLSQEVIIDFGGVKTKPGDYSSEPFHHYWYVETTTKLPSWKNGGNPYCMNFRGNMDRFDEDLELWFYTFELSDETVIEWLTLSEYDEINGC